MSSRVTIGFFCFFCADWEIKMAPLRAEFCCKLCGFEVLAVEHFETARLWYAGSLSQLEG